MSRFMSSLMDHLHFKNPLHFVGGNHTKEVLGDAVVHGIPEADLNEDQRCLPIAMH